MLEKNIKYNQGDRVYFFMGKGLPDGFGDVCGIVGPVIIIKLEKSLTGYPFTHIYAIDSQITPAATTELLPGVPSKIKDPASDVDTSVTDDDLEKAILNCEIPKAQDNVSHKPDTSV